MNTGESWVALKQHKGMCRIATANCELQLSEGKMCGGANTVNTLNVNSEDGI